MVSSAIDLLFGCKHQFGFPITRRSGGTTYQVCVLCGAEFEYDWKTLRRVRRIREQKESGEKESLAAYADRTAVA